MDDEFEETVRDVLSGSAVLFLGAGFSLGAKDSFGKEVPSTGTLTSEICDLAGVAESEGGTLSDLAEYCDSDSRLKSELNSLLIDRLTNCKPAELHSNVLALPWRAVFTTNFDDVAEAAMESKNTQIVTPISDNKNVMPDRTPLYYLHGRALDVVEGKVDPKFVVSETNYINLAAENRELYSALDNEIAAAKRIVFIGYSIRDAEIAGRLFNIQGIAKRSAVITGPELSNLERHRLTKFGRPYDVGTEGFYSRVLSISESFEEDPKVANLGFISRLKPSVPSAELTVDMVESLLLTGNFSRGEFVRQLQLGSGDNPYCVTRSAKIDKVFDTSKTVNRIVATSDLGNGKTVFCEQVVAAGLERGFDVVRVETNLQEQYPELDSLLSDKSKRLYVVDDYIRYQKFANYIGNRLPGNAILLVTLRQGLDEVGFAQITKHLGGIVRELDLNPLDASELAEWDKLLERWGFWGGKIKDNSVDRIKFLNRECGAENRSVLVSIFKNSSIADKVHSTVQFFINRNPNEKTAFIAVLINAMCQNHVNWTQLVDWLSIDESSFKEAVLASPVSSLIGGARYWQEFSSAALADFILNNYEFDVDLVVGVYTEIVRNTAYSSTDLRSGLDSRENLKELMKFRFLTRLFASNSDAERIISAVYQRLSVVPKIRKHDQFWLQYAMARMEVGDLDAAERYLKTAVGIVEKRGGGYGLRQIHDQRIRLIFRKYSEHGSKVDAAQVYMAIDDLKLALKDANEFVIYPLRSAAQIAEFLDRQIDELDFTLRAKIEAVIDEMSEVVKGTLRLERAQKGETRRIRETIHECKLILTNA